MGILNLFLGKPKNEKSFDVKNHNQRLRKNNLSDAADRNEKQIEHNQQQNHLIQKMMKAEELSKTGDIQESLVLLSELRSQGNFDQPSRLYERLAINYRKIKNYDKEIEVIQEFLNMHQAKYGEKMWKDSFEKRLEKAEILRSKIKK
ncbi:hypothetical protein [Lactococcus lactis]|uniref:hypothetical protein n=1 Tax=Lactococcus lactis TaxID=1358 RepID=UPI0023A955FF|nr:hypothetical protein [Lactococcus lactis]WEA55723.1 hypothetical protein PWP91_03050 [Lactococcus lactis]